MRNTLRKKALSSHQGARKLKIPRVVVAGLRGGSGKTTLSLGLIAALRSRGFKVAAFKKGPDYIDAGWLAEAAGAPCYNLDPFIVGQKELLSSFAAHAPGADFAVIEGNRGLFDGMDARGSMSTSSVAALLRAPVVLIVDCTKSTRTLAAMLKGVERFEPGLRLAGIVLNQIAGERHERVIRDSMAMHLRTPVIGAIPRLNNLMPERHMGLTPSQEHPEVRRAIKKAGKIVEKYVDLDALIAAATAAPALGAAAEGPKIIKSPNADGPLIGVIRDSAFQFYYPENIEALTLRGARVLEISALDEQTFPALDALYIGGGFPETHAIALAGNRGFKRGLRKAVNDGLPVYAECGGLIYLGRSLRTGGKTYPMAGVLPLRFSLRSKPSAHGYTVLKVRRGNPFFKRGQTLKGHEFHYSEVTGMGDGVSFALRNERGRGIAGGLDGICLKNVFAAYSHLHALGSPEWADGMLRAARKYQKSKIK